VSDRETYLSRLFRFKGGGYDYIIDNKLTTFYRPAIITMAPKMKDTVGIKLDIWDPFDPWYFSPKGTPEDQNHLYFLDRFDNLHDCGLVADWEIDVDLKEVVFSDLDFRYWGTTQGGSRTYDKTMVETNELYRFRSAQSSSSDIVAKSPLPHAGNKKAGDDEKVDGELPSSQA
jgi:hypothetical protein